MPLSRKEVDRHIAVINDELGHVKEDVATLKADVQWLKKFQWLILTSSIGALLVGLIRIYI